MVGGNDAGQQIESVLNQVPNYQSRRTDQICVNRTSIFRHALRLPGSGNCEYGKNRCQNQDKRFIFAVFRIGILNQLSEDRLDYQTDYAGKEAYPRAVNDVDIINTRDLRGGDQTGNYRDDGADAECRAAQAENFF